MPDTEMMRQRREAPRYASDALEALRELTLSSPRLRARRRVVALALMIERERQPEIFSYAQLRH